MTGLEKIIAEIREEAAAEAADITAKAKAEADSIVAAAKAETDAKTAKIETAAKQGVADIEQGRDSAIALQRRQRTLAAKQEVLAETLQKALESLYGMEDGEYFDLIITLAAGTAQNGKGEMLFNEEDAKRLPGDFAKKLAAALPKGAELAVSKETRPIDGGFVLKYGDIEENCSFKDIFAARADEFSDLVRDVLFA